MTRQAPSITAPDWQRIAGWLAAADIDCIEVAAPGIRMRMVRSAAGYRVEDPGTAASMQTSCAQAPCAGVFLQAHPLRHELLATAGRPVAAGEVVGLLRIGLILVPVTAPIQGTVVRTLVPHDRLVGYGTPVVEIRTGQP